MSVHSVNRKIQQINHHSLYSYSYLCHYVIVIINYEFDYLFTELFSLITVRLKLRLLMARQYFITNCWTLGNKIYNIFFFRSKEAELQKKLILKIREKNDTERIFSKLLFQIYKLYYQYFFLVKDKQYSPHLIRLENRLVLIRRCVYILINLFYF